MKSFLFRKTFWISTSIASFKNLAAEEIVAKLRSLGGYENIYRQQLASIFKTLFSPNLTPKLKKPMPRPASRSKSLTPTSTLRPDKPLSLPKDYK